MLTSFTQDKVYKIVPAVELIPFLTFFSYKKNLFKSLFATAAIHTIQLISYRMFILR